MYVYTRFTKESEDGRKAEAAAAEPRAPRPRGRGARAEPRPRDGLSSVASDGPGQAHLGTFSRPSMLVSQINLDLIVGSRCLASGSCRVQVLLTPSTTTARRIFRPSSSCGLSRWKAFSPKPSRFFGTLTSTISYFGSPGSSMITGRGQPSSRRSCASSLSGARSSHCWSCLSSSLLLSRQ